MPGLPLTLTGSSVTDFCCGAQPVSLIDVVRGLWPEGATYGTLGFAAGPAKLIADRRRGAARFSDRLFRRSAANYIIIATR
jgi:hypothetical protein